MFLFAKYFYTSCNNECKTDWSYTCLIQERPGQEGRTDDNKYNNKRFNKGDWVATGSTVNQNHEDTYKTSNIFILYKTLSEVINVRYLKYTKNTQNHHKSLLSTTPWSHCPFKYFSLSLFTLVLSVTFVSHCSISRPWHREAMLLCCVIVWKHDTDPTPRGPEGSCRITEAFRVCRSSQSDAFVFWWFTFATTLKK